MFAGLRLNAEAWSGRSPSRLPSVHAVRQAVSVITSSTAPMVWLNLMCSRTQALDRGPRSGSVRRQVTYFLMLSARRTGSPGGPIAREILACRTKSADVRRHDRRLARHRLAHNQALRLQEDTRENREVRSRHEGGNVRSRSEERDPVAFRQAFQFVHIRRRSGGTGENQVHAPIETANSVDEEMRTLNPFQPSGKYHHRFLSADIDAGSHRLALFTWKRDETIDIDTGGNGRDSSWIQSGPRDPTICGIRRWGDRGRGTAHQCVQPGRLSDRGRQMQVHRHPCTCARSAAKAIGTSPALCT